MLGEAGLASTLADGSPLSRFHHHSHLHHPHRHLSSTLALQGFLYLSLTPTPVFVVFKHGNDFASGHLTRNRRSLQGFIPANL